MQSIHPEIVTRLGLVQTDKRSCFYSPTYTDKLGLEYCLSAVSGNVLVVDTKTNFGAFFSEIELRALHPDILYHAIVTTLADRFK